MPRQWLILSILGLGAALVALGGLSSESGASASGPPGQSGLDRSIAAQEAHTDRLMAIPGVVGTAVGLNPGGQPVVKIYTESVAVHGLPTSLDNVPVLVEVTGRIFALAPPPTVASFTYACSDLTCDFDASASSGRGKFSYNWDFGDGTPNGSGVTARHTYAASATYQVTLVATASKSGSDSETQGITVGDGGGGVTNNQPTASFTSSCTDLTCDFSDTSTDSDGIVAAWSWGFGDSNTSTQQHPTHTYGADGTYTVTLTVTDDDGATGNYSQSVTVSNSGVGGTNSPPISSFAYTCADPTCDFTDTSSDSDGTVVAWSWDFGDGGTSTAQHPNHTYASGGTHTVALTVTDNGGATDTTSQSVAVSSNCTSTTERCWRPAPIGVSTGHPDISAGTIGSRVTDGTNVFALSNNHVYANSNNASLGDPTLQPGPYDGGTSPADDIGTLYDYEPIQFNGPNNYMDAAIALSSTTSLGNATPSDGYGTPSSALVSATLNLPVQKYGRTTSLTMGVVAEINVTVDICYAGIIVCTKWARFVDQIGITPGSFSAGGDSGSLIVTDDANKNPIGLLFAGSSTRTIANRIDLVLTRFGVTIDGAGSSGPSVTVTSPADGSVVEGTAVAVAADTTDDVGVTQVEFFVNGTSIGVDTDNSDGWSATWDTTSLSNEDSDNTVTATATNTADKSASSTVTVTVDNTDNLPSVTITSPVNGATISRTVTITADATDDRGVSQVEFFVGSTSIGVDTTAPFAASWDTTTATDGGYTVTATATDSATQTASDGINITVDNSTATTVSVDSVTYSTEGPHLLITVTLVNDLGNPVSGASVSIFLFNTTTGQLWIGTGGTTGDDGSETWRLRQAPSGCYTTIVTDITADGLTWAGSTPANEFCK